MKQDSYPRFIKSELYKVYLMREMEGKPLQLPKSEEEEQTGKGKKDKKKSKDREAEEKDKEKRRRSLLPLPWNKSRHTRIKFTCIIILEIWLQVYPLSAISCITVKEKLRKKGLVQKGDTKYMYWFVSFYHV